MGNEMELNPSPDSSKIKKTPTQTDALGRIRALSQDVVNKIAAGEIIVAPVHALKELLENSVDAGSTSLEIIAKDGGLKLLQISDNGHGINRDDLPILCERFTTSKLKAFEDLTSIATYGFRGEALASISHIAHLSIITRTKESSCAYKAQYADGKLVPAKPGQSADPKPAAGQIGTRITVEDLFYNIPTRRRAFRSGSEEYAKILDMVGRYAVHCEGVAFSCKKQGDSSMGIFVPVNASTIDRIRQIHGSSVANELVEVKVSSDRWGFTASGWVSNANYSVKRTTLLLFINHRSVESSAIKKAFEQIYTIFLPKGGHPFIYLSLEIDPQRVDVNVHPTKREVNFLNEDEIIETICDEIRGGLTKVDTSRTFLTQSLLPGVSIPTIPLTPSKDSQPSTPQRDPRTTQKSTTQKSNSQRPYENALVRTDSRVRKITSMLPPTTRPSNEANGEESQPLKDIEYEYSDKEHVSCRLTTIRELRAAVRDEMHSALTDVFASHTFVGIVDARKRIAAIQGGVKLYLVDYGMLCNEYFYQLGLTDFGNFGSIRFNPVLNLTELLTVAAEQEKAVTGEDALDWDEVVTLVRDQLMGRRNMLEEYFALEISEEGELLSIPLMMKGYTPSLAKLPQFLLRLGPKVNWSSEKECFHTFLVELAAFYVPEPLPPESVLGQMQGEEDAEEHGELAARRKHVLRALENVIFPALKARLVATKGLLKGVVEVADLKGLYRVFERC
ncbi:DNA mismatch repair protein MutL [Patellaria atrata CBS 101060]|uniref:DNA mismatch repair protein MutL n=1 Tax=Patellaria atrata CBS 101060 TaxID=1346257 RepID=A0A9P4VMP8_9PEZI|nr:DNA mismatch repair protein MutL [Patellaria atrata CBS 101060]